MEKHEGRHNQANVGYLWRNWCIPCTLSSRICACHCWHGSERGAVSHYLPSLYSVSHIFLSRAKYPLAVVEKMLLVFGKDLGGGFNIGCRFKTTLDNSQLGPCAHELNYKSLVSGFHGHAHWRLCQLSHLATYIKGLGLEDLEGCEQPFSKSNFLAAPLRYASIFHWIHSIATYFEHNDNMEVFQNLSKWYMHPYLTF